MKVEVSLVDRVDGLSAVKTEKPCQQTAIVNYRRLGLLNTGGLGE